MFLKGKITETNNIFLEIYDPVKDEIVLSWPVMVLNVNWDWTKTDTELSKTLALALLPFLEKISGKPFYPLHLEINPPQTTLYVNELFASQKILYLPQGEHTFKAVKPGFTHKRGQIDLFKPSKLSVTLQKEESKIPVLVQTTQPVLLFLLMKLTMAFLLLKPNYPHKCTIFAYLTNLFCTITLF